jgi:HEAT repeat protein
VDRLDLERATVGELRDELQRGARDDEEPFAYLSDVALALGRRSGTPELLDVFDELADADAARAIVFAAAEEDASAAPVRSFLRALLDDEREFVAAEALDGLAFGATPLDGETLERLSHHPSPYVRGALLRYLARRRGRTAIPELMAGLQDGSHIVRQNAVDELEQLEVRDAIPALRRLLDDDDRDVRAAVRHALQTLADG